MTSTVDGGPVRARAGWAWPAVAGLLLLATLAPEPAHAQTGICGRTEDVRDALVAQISGVSDCALVTDAHLAAITGGLDLSFRDLNAPPLALAAGDFDGLTALTTLSLGVSRLATLPDDVFDELTALTTLLLDHNLLTTLPDDVFDELTALTTLFLTDNNLTTLPDDVFDELTALTTLSLSGNNLTTLPDDVFDELTALRELDLEANPLAGLPDDVFDGLTLLTTLSLRANNLTTLPDDVFDELTALTTLSLSSNLLTTLPDDVFDGLTALRELDMEANPLARLPDDVFDGLTALTTLSLSGNNLTTLPDDVFDGLTALRELDMEANPLARLPDDVFDGLTLLTTLSLSGNNLTELPDDVFDGLTALTTLSLSGNKLTALPDDVFDGLTALTTLSFSGNKLTALPDDVFDELTLLTTLSLRANNLTTLPDDVFDGLTALRELDLATNPGAPFAPTAVALPDDGTISAAGGTVTLDGSGSGGAWGTNVTYGWALPNPASGVTVTFDNNASAKPVVTIPALTEDTELAFTLTVTGRGGTSGIAPATDTAKVTVLPAPAVLISGADGLKTGEDGTTATFQVRLATAPVNEVTVTPLSSDTGEGTVSGALTFTTTNWNTARTVTMTGVDDADVDGEQTFSITFRVESTDPDYAGISVPAVSVTNDDDESLALNLDTIAGDDTVNIAEKAAGFTISGDTGSEGGVSVTVTVGNTPLTATSDSGGAWSVAVPANAAYLTGTGVAVTVSASKTGFTSPSDVTRALAVDLTAPSATYTAPSSLQVGVAVGAMTPSTTDTDIASYGATGLPPGLGIDSTTGAISGTPGTADANTASATVTVTDTAGNPATVSIAFPAVARGNQTLTGFAYSPATVTYGDTAPTVTAPGGVQTTLSYSATPSDVCTVDSSTGALTPVEVGACVITATAAGTADWNQATATFTVTVAAAGALALNLDAIAGDDTVNIVEKAAGFTISGATGSEGGVSVTVTVGSTPLTATSGAGGAWSVAVPADAAYLTGTGVAVTVSASKTGYTAPSDVTRTLAVDLAAPSATYTAPSSLQVGVAVGAMTPSTTDTDIASYGATGLPPGLGIDSTTGAISGTPGTADANTASATVTVTDTAGNPATVSIAFPAVARGNQTLTGFAYSPATVTYGDTAPAVTAPGGVQTTLAYSATPSDVCTVDASTGALTLVGVGDCNITATAAPSDDYNQGTATYTVTVAAAGTLVLNLDTIAGDNTVNIAEKAAGFTISGATGSEGGVSVSVTLGSQSPLTATSGAGGAWSVAVPADAAYLTGASVAVTVSASKTGYTAPSDVTRTLAVDLAAPSATYTAPSSLQVGVAVGAMTPSTTDTDIASYGATGLPPGLGIDSTTGAISGTPGTADANTASATVTVTDTAGNPATVSIAFPAVARGNQTLTGFAYSPASVTYGDTAPAVTAPGGVQTTLSYSATPSDVCTVDASTGALTPVGVGDCNITATAAPSDDYNQGTATYTVTVAAAGTLVLNLDTIAGDNTVNIAEKAAGFAISGDTGSEGGVSVTVTVGSTPLTATSGAGGAWSVAVPADAAYLTGASVAVTVSASKTGYTAPSDVTRTLAVDLAAPSATYTAPSSLQVGVAVGAMTPSTTDIDIASYGATGLPPGLGIDSTTGAISGTPGTADANTASATVTVTDTAGNPATVSIAFPAVARGNQTLTGFAYSPATVTYGDTAPTVTAPSGVQTTLSYSATPSDVCTVDASTGALTLVGVGDCNITATAAPSDDYNQGTATYTVTVAAAGTLVLNLDTIAGDNTVNIAEKAAGFAISGDTGSEGGVSVTVTVGSTPLTATSGAGGAWSVAVPADAAYLTGASVAVTVSASKTGYTAPSDVTRTLAVDLAAPSATYTAPSSLQVGVAVGAMTPSTTDIDIASYGATGLPPGLGIDSTTGAISGTPGTADANTASATVTVTDTAGNPATVSIAFPAVARGNQTLTGFAYSPATVTYGDTAPTVTAPSGVQTTLSYSATPSDVCTVDASTGALTLVGVGDCVITATAAGTADWNQATATVTVTVQAAGALALNLDTIAGDNTVNIAEKAAGFAISGATGSEGGVSVTVTVGSTPLTATSGAGGAWSVAVPADAAYLTGASVAVTVSASKTGYTAPSDVTRTLAVDLAAPSATYTAPSSLQVGVAVGAMTPSTTDIDIASYGATGLPSGLGIDSTTGAISGTPGTADANTASATVTVTDTAGNPATVSIAFPAVARGNQTLTGFAYSPATVTYGDTAPTVTAPSGVQTTLSYSATPSDVCTVDASTGALTPVGVGDCNITATAAPSDDYNQGTATYTVTVAAAGTLVLNLDTIAGDNTVNIAEKAAGFAISGDTGSEGGVSVTVTVGSTPLTATSGAGGAWSVAVPADAAYLTGASVAVTVSASKTGYTAPSDVTRTLAVDLAAPSATYTAPSSLQVGVAVGAMTPSTTDIDIASYGATGLPPGLGIDSTTGAISGTPGTADANTASATVTVTDTAGNPATVSIAFPAVARGNQTLTGFAYSPATVTYGDTAPTVTAPSGVQTTLSYSATPSDVCTVDASTGALTLVGVGDCNITATAAPSDDYNQGTATYTVTVAAAGTLVLNLDTIAGDNTVNIAEKAAGFTISGATGSEGGVSVSVTLGSQSPLTATSGAGGAWSVAVPADAAYLTGASVAVTVSASKTGYTAPSDVTRTLAVDLAAPSATYTAPSSLQVGVAVGAMTPSTTDTDIASYGATGLPPGLGIDTGTGVIGGTPGTADANTADATVTVTDTAGNPATVSIAFPAVARGNQTLTGFAYSPATVTYGDTAPAVTAPSGVQTTLAYSATPATVCTVDASTGALTLVGVGDCVITATAAGTADWNQATATVTVTVQAAGALALNLDTIAGDNTVNIAEKAAGFAISGATGSEGGVSISVTLGSQSPLTATSGAGGAWSVAVPADAAYLTGASVAVTVSASKTGYTAPSDVTRTLAVDLAAPSATYTAPSSLQVGVAVGAMTPSTTDIDIASYGATGLPPGLGIDSTTGAISGTPGTADANTASATVTVTDTAGNPATVSIAFPAVARGNQTLTGFAYSPATVTYGDTAPTVTAPSGVQTTLAYSATPATVCTVDASTGALTLVGVGDCVITATAAGTADWNQATATVTVTVQAAGALALNLDTIAGDNTVNIAEKAAGFAISGATGSEGGVSVTVTVGSTPLTATSGAGGAWSVAVPADAAYLTGASVAVTVSASKTGYTAPSDVTRTLAVDLAAPSATYTAPSSLQVGVAVGAMTPSTTDTDIASYGATGLPPGLGIDTGTGVIGGTPGTADANTADATVTVTDTAGNPATVSIAFPAVARGNQTLTGFAYSPATVTYGDTAPAVTAPSGVQTTLAYSATPATVCTVDASTGALTLVGVGDCVITATAAGTADWNQATATVTVTVQAAGALALNLDTIAGDNTVNIAEKAAGFAISGATGSEGGVSVTVTVGSTPLTATSGAGGAWSVAVPADAAYLTGASVAVTVSASKTGYTAPSDVTRTLAVDLAAPSATYTAPSSLQVGVAVGAMTPSTTDIDIASYGATGLPSGLGIDSTTGAISGTPGTADANTASATVTVTDTAGNPATVSIAFPAVARGNQTLTGFAYSPATVTYGDTAPTVTAPSGVQTTLSYSATPSDVCTVDSSTGALTLEGAGECVITATAAPNDDYNRGTASYTVTVADDPEGLDIAVSAPAAVDEDARAAVVTVTLTTRQNRAPTANTELYYVGKPGETATRDADYTPPPGRDFGTTGVFFATVRPSAFSPNAAGTAWVAQPSFTIGIIDDQKAELAETIVFTITLGNDRSRAHTITIRDNDAIAPGRPTGLQAAPRSPTVIQLSWTAPSAGSFSITGYRVEASENASGPWSVVAADTRNTRPSWGHGGLSAGATRHYRVSAISPAGTSGPSNVASATTIAAGPAGTNAALPLPSTVYAVPKLPGEIRLSWWRDPNAASHELVDSHQYRYRVRDAGAWTVDWTSVNQTLLPEPWPTDEIRNYNKVLLEGLSAGTTYEFQVRAVDKDGGTSAAVSVLGTATGRQTVWIQADTGPVEEGEPLRFTLWRDQPHGPMMAIVRISETEDMLPPEGRSREGLWHQQVHFGDGNDRIQLVLETVNDHGGPEEPSAVTVEVMSYPLGGSDTLGNLENPDNEHLYDVKPDMRTATITVTAAEGGSRSGTVEALTAEPLTAAFEGVPAAHDGATAFSFRIAFSEAVSVTPEAMRTRVLDVAGGAVTGAARVDGERGVWSITVTPDSREELSITLAPAADCEADGAVCTADGRALSVVAAHSVSGPGPESQTQAPPPLTATFPASPYTSRLHTGSSDRPQVIVAFSEALETIAATTPSATVTGATIASVQAHTEDGLSNAWLFFLTPNGDGDVTFALGAGAACDNGGICSASGTTLTVVPAALTIPGPGAADEVDEADEADEAEDTAEAPALTATFPASPYTSRLHTGSSDRPQVVVAFSEALETIAATTPSATVTGATIASVQAHTEDGLSNAWLFFLTPNGDGDVTFALGAGAACDNGGICSASGTTLTVVPAALTILGPGAADEVDEADEAEDTAEAPPLTASFRAMPSEHGGPGERFTFNLAFSEAPRLSYVTLRDHAFTVRGGSVRSAQRLRSGSNIGWRITLEPTGWSDVAISLPGGRACTSSGAICTADNRRLGNSPSATVRGPPVLMVADTRTTEGAGATLDFVVRLGRAASGTVTVDYATADGSATAGADYTAASGTLTFSAGQTTKTVSVTVLDDAHDDDGETFTLRLSNAAGARIAIATATGTIENSDPLPKGWLSRFGRTSAMQVVGLLDARFDEARTATSQLTLGGRSVTVSALGGHRQDSTDPAGGPVDPGAGAAADADPFAALDNDLAAPHAGLSADPDLTAPAVGAGGEATLLERLAWGLLTRSDWSIDRRQFLSRSGFNLSLSALGGETDGEAIETARVLETPGRWSLWGRGALTRFAGRDTEVSVDGDVLTGLLGVDYSRDRWLAGLALSYHDGNGTYRASGDAGAGTLDSTLVSVHPYLHYALTDRLSAWGALGYGQGALRLRLARGAGDGLKSDPIETGMQMGMGALGLRGVLYASVGTELALKSDALWVRTSSEDAPGIRAVDNADTSRIRLLLSGRHQRALANDALFTPSFELGLRFDDGDAERGFGLELGGGLRYADPVRGLALETRARALLAHEDGGYEEWGVGGSLTLDPGRLGRGLALRLDSGWGMTDSGAEALWQRQTTAGLARQHGAPAQGRITAEMGYGLDVPYSYGILTPYGSMELAGGGSRTLRLGWRFELGQRLSLSLAGERRETALARPEHGLMLRTTLPW